jgi:outer membrane immunogenic protein
MFGHLDDANLVHEIKHERGQAIVRRLTDSWFVGGGQICYNWQVGPSWVLGVEADFDGTSAKSSTTAAFPAVFPGDATVYNRELDTLGTVRGRLGFLSSPGLLWYATGGLAYGETKIWSGFICATCLPSGTANQSSNTSAGHSVAASSGNLPPPGV